MGDFKIRYYGSDIVSEGDHLLCYPRGLSMRPFIRGGSIVRCSPLRSNSRETLRLGDILLFKIENRLFVHRLVGRHKNPSGSDFLVLRGDPMSTAERITIDQVYGIAEHATWDNSTPINLRSGFTGFLNRLFGSLMVGFHRLERPTNDSSASYSDRNHYLLNGWLHRIIFVIFSPLTSFLLWLNTAISRDARRVRKQQLRQEKEFLAALLQGATDGSSEAQSWQIRFILDHQIAGIIDMSQQPHASWTPILKERKHQLLKTINAQFQTNQIIQRCNAAGLNPIPLKALALFADLYATDPSRRAFGDIDLYVAQPNIQSFHEQALLLGYTLINKGALDPKRLQAKQKVEYYPPQSGALPLDVHTTIISKKLIRPFLGLLEADLAAQSRTVTVDGAPWILLDEIHEWLYLAQHWVLHHRIGGIKWLFDLMLLLDRMTATDRTTLFEAAEAKGFRAITAAVFQAIQVYRGSEITVPETLQISSALGRFWTKQALYPDNFLRNRFTTARRNNLVNKARATYWELLFIDQLSDRLVALLRMLLPSVPMLKTFYEINSILLAIIIYPFHCLVAASGGIIFLGDTVIRGLRPPYVHRKPT